MAGTCAATTIQAGGALHTFHGFSYMALLQKFYFIYTVLYGAGGRPCFLQHGAWSFDSNNRLLRASSLARIGKTPCVGSSRQKALNPRWSSSLSQPCQGASPTNRKANKFGAPRGTAMAAASQIRTFSDEL